ncbi:MAG: pro-sigmaK processing inhibitor BofA [Veillonellaceae bacterium]|jgi:inhibitor of the pro-sigma K processing machinery|nr:pro-sigmaK processing inhibitor BofA [Veillonellaceae bacterium]
MPIIAAYAVGIVLILLLGRILVFPLKVVLKLVYNGLIGGLVLWLANLVGAPLGFALPITVWTALLVGFLGIPGVLLLIFYYVFFLGRAI